MIASTLKRLWFELNRPRGRGERTHRGRSSRGGVAMLLVLATIALLTVVVMEITRSATVRIQLAAHQRDEAAAEALAMGGIEFYRLFLIASKQVDDSPLVEMISQMIPGGINSASLWEIVPQISTGTLRLLLAAGGDQQTAEEIQANGGLTEEQNAMTRDGTGVHTTLKKPFLDFDGDFVATVKDEDGRIYVGNFRATNMQELQTDVSAGVIHGMMSDDADSLWLRQINLDPWELVGDLADWTDADDNRIYEGGSEQSLYDQGDDPYRPKNAAFDSVDEIRLVNNWGRDDLWERFGRLFTIYGTGRINVNTAKGKVLQGLFNRYMTPPPTDPQPILDAIHAYRSTPIVQGGGIFRTGQDFVQFLRSVSMATVDDGMVNAISTKSTVFRVTSEGRVGKSKVSIEAVFDFDKNNRVGKVVYWHVQ